MARYPGAVWRPLPENSRQAKITPRLLIFHTAVDAPGPTNLWGFFARVDVGAESHFWSKYRGGMEQFMDTGVKANANRTADSFAISVETEDEGKPNELLWTPEQQEDLINLGVWFCRTYSVPAVMCESPYGTGFGYHSQWNDSRGRTPWSLYPGKTCPGIRRRETVPDLVDRIRQRLGGITVITPPKKESWFDMATKEELIEAVEAVVQPKIAALSERINTLETTLGDWSWDTREYAQPIPFRFDGEDEQYMLIFSEGKPYRYQITNLAERDALIAAEQISGVGPIVIGEPDKVKALKAIPVTKKG